MSDQSLTAADRRVAARRRCSRVCYARPNGTAAGVVWGAALQDVSTAGLSLLLSRELPPGMLLLIQPPRDSTAPALLARVIRVAAQADGWLHGCQLLQPLGEIELQDWVG